MDGWMILIIKHCHDVADDMLETPQMHIVKFGRTMIQ